MIMNKLLLHLSQKINKEKGIYLKRIDELKVNPKFKNLYEQEKDKVEEICKNIKENGFDSTQPIIILEDDTVIDGHSRLQAAIMAGLKEVYVVQKKGLGDTNQALIYEENLNLLRRNLTEGQKIAHIENLLKLKQQAKSEGKDVGEFSDEAIGKKLNVSPRQIQKYKETIAKSTPQQLESIRSGKATLNQVHEEIKKKEGITRKSPVSKKVLQLNNETNNYIPRILLLLKKYQPDFQITDNFKKELDEIFKIKEVLNETKQQS